LKEYCKKGILPVTWSFVFLNAEVKAELDALPVDMRASFERIVDLVQAVGLERVHEPYIGQPQPALNLAQSQQTAFRRKSAAVKSGDDRLALNR